MDRVTLLKKDIRGFVMSYIYFFLGVIIRIVCTLWCRLKMKLWGIEFGKGCSFRGNMLFNKAPGSTMKIGDRCVFNSNDRFNNRGMNHKCILQTTGSGKISIGDRCGFSGVSIVSSISVTIGDDVMCGTNVMIGDRNDHEKKYPEWQPAPINIGNNVWIGMNSIVMRGVIIGDNTIIGAGSIVTKSIPANVIAAGSPCRVIKER